MSAQRVTAETCFRGLPFVAPDGAPRKNGHRDWWWNVRPTGTDEDCITGARYAKMLLDYVRSMRKADRGGHLVIVAESMDRAKPDQVAIGFWTAIELAAIDGAPAIDDLLVRWQAIRADFEQLAAKP